MQILLPIVLFISQARLYSPSTWIISTSLIRKHDWGAQARWDKWLEELVFPSSNHWWMLHFTTSDIRRWMLKGVWPQCSHRLSSISWNTIVLNWFLFSQLYHIKRPHIKWNFIYCNDFLSTSWDVIALWQFLSMAWCNFWCLCFTSSEWTTMHFFFCCTWVQLREREGEGGRPSQPYLTLSGLYRTVFSIH